VGLRLIAMLLISPVICATALLRPFVGLCLLVIMYYFRPDVYEAPAWFRPQLWYTIAVGVGWLTHLKGLKFPPLLALAYLVVGLFWLLSPLAEGNPDVARASAGVVFKLVIVMMFTVNLVDTPRKMHWFLWSNIIGMVYNLKAIILGGGGEHQRVDVAVGQGGGANYIGMVMAMSVPWLYMRVLNAKGIERLCAIGLAPLYILAIVLTGSRAGFLSLGAVGLYMLFRSNKKLIGSAVLAVFAVIFVLVIPEHEVERFNQGLGVEGKRDRSAESRLQLWQAAIRMFDEHPITGVGLDNYAIFSPRYAGFSARGKGEIAYEPGMSVGKGFVTHSTWFQMLAEGGLVVGVPFFLMFPVAFLTLRGVKKRAKRFRGGAEVFQQAVALEGALIAFMVSSTFGSHFKIDFMWWYLGAVAALGIVARQLAFTNGPLVAVQEQPSWKPRPPRAPAPARV
jgi:O-antigen ligase